MITLLKLCRYLDQLFSVQGVVDSCPNGLQCEGKREITHIATAVSASLATIEAAVKAKADALIVHHGLFWKNDSPVIEGTKRSKLKVLLDNDISLFAYHLPLDLHREIGNNWKAARDLGWSDCQPFGFFGGVPIGVKGRIANTDRAAFQETLQRYYSHAATTAYGGPQTIETVALISGGAYKSLSDAAKEGVDAFITGSFDEPVWHTAFEENINFYALGHSATERVGPIALAECLQQKLAVPCTFIDVDNPF